MMCEFTINRAGLVGSIGLGLGSWVLGLDVSFRFVVNLIVSFVEVREG